jgi:hypothetical protein
MFRNVVGLSGVIASLYGVSAYALNWEIPAGEDRIKTVLNLTFTQGAGMRMQAQSANLIGKSNLDPNVCGVVGNVQYISCQGTLQGQTFPAARLAQAPGAASVNSDDGDLNYGKGSFFSGVFKFTPDFKAEYKGFGVFGRALFFHDFVNSDFTQYHPNRITPDNLNTSGFSTADIKLPNTYTWLPIIGPISLPDNPLIHNPLSYPGSRIYGAGQVVRDKRDNDEVKHEVGEALQWLDSYGYGKIPLWGERELSFKVGRHTLNWGESTTLVTNSINSINPVDVNNFLRIGNQVEEDFIPVNMASLSFQPIDNTTVEGFYQLEWKPTEIPAPGSYFSSLDVGSNNAINNLNLGFGGAAEDPNGVGRLLYNPLAQLGSASATMMRLPDIDAKTQGQFGVKLDHYFENFNNGTDLALYYERYNSRLPFLSLYATNPSCARAAGSKTGLDATHFFGSQTDQTAFIQTCPAIPLVLPGLLQTLGNTGAVGGGPTDSEPQYGSAAPLDTMKFQFQYPDGIHLFGASFNTTVGSWSVQGEVAYRPHQPLQVDVQDLVFAAAGPTLSNCAQSIGCEGTAPLYGTKFGDFSFDNTGATVGYGTSDVPGQTDNINIGKVNTLKLFGLNLVNTYGTGALPSPERAFPNFIIPYRGGQLAQNQACAYGTTADQYNPSNPCWIRGWEYFQTYEFNLGTTKVFGKTENWFDADQVQLVGEAGAMYVPQLPSLDKLQLEAFGTNYAASAGADGSGADGSRQACSTSRDCVVGADGLRFNPHQQDLTGYPDKISWGYRMISIWKYESVLPGISLQPTLFYSQDVMGTSPGPGGNFTAGSKIASVSLETRYKSATAFTFGYTWFWGGGQYNPLSDRDFLQFALKVQF